MSERNIFKYWNGSKEVGIDPSSVARKLMTSQLSWNLKDINLMEVVVLKMSKLKDDQELAEVDKAALLKGQRATDELLSSTRTVFGVEPFDYNDGSPTGLTDEEVLELFTKFTEYMDGVKKNTSTKANSPTPTVPASSEK